MVSMSGRIQTVLGDVEPASIGVTLPHEHLFIDLSKGFVEPKDPEQRKLAYSPISLENFGWILHDTDRHYDSCIIKDLELVCSEVEKFRNAGGMTIADVTPIDIGRWPEGLAAVSKKTGLKVICGTGFYVDFFNHEDLKEKSARAIEKLFIEEITQGIEPSGIKAGLIGEIGVSEPWTDSEKKVCRAAAQAQIATGAALYVHPGRSRTSPFDVLRLLKEEGVDTRRVIICHLDRTLDKMEDYKLLSRFDCYMELDLFGLMGYYSAKLTTFPVPGDEGRAILLQNLIKEGCLERLLISQDVCTKVRLTKFGGYGFAHILKNVVPRMLKIGITTSDLDRILVENPRDALTIS